MSDEKIPVYSIPDLAKSDGAIDFEIRDLGEGFRAAKKNVLHPHRHNSYELFWITSGSGTLTVDFDDYEINPPMALVFSPGRVHGWQISDIPEGFVIRFGNEFYASEAREATNISDVSIFCSIGGDPVLYLNEEQNNQFETLTKSIHQEFSGEAYERDSALRSFMRLWLINARRVADQNRPSQNLTAGYFLTRRFLLLVEQNFRDNLTVKNYAERLKVTSNHLSATLKENMDKTPGEVIRERMLIEAKRLLRYSEMGISDIAFQLNFEDPSYFARYFRKHSDQTPSDFRESVTN